MTLCPWYGSSLLPRLARLDATLTAPFQAKRQKSQHVKPESDSDDEPIAAKKARKLPPSYKVTSMLDDSDDDKPLGAKLAATKANIEKAAAKEAKAIRASNAKKAPPKREWADAWQA